MDNWKTNEYLEVFYFMWSNLNNYSWKVITEYGDGTLIDFSVNTNSLGIPRTVKENMNAIADISDVYPDPECNQLTACLAEKYNVPATHILCGNGADDLLYRVVFAVKPKHAIIVEPTFEEYQRALKLVNCNVLHYTLSESDGFELDEKILSVIQPDCDMLFLCNPNNPTGQIVSKPFIEKILDCCAENNIIVVIDECFIEFLPQWRDYSAKRLTTKYENLVVIDAFTKTYSLAGFRLGFCISSNIRLLSRMYSCGQSFSVSTPAQFAGLCVLMDETYMQKTYQFLLSERDWLVGELEKLPLMVFPSKGNFLLFKSPTKNMLQELLIRGIKVRDCSQFYGLSSAYCRIAIRKHSDNELLLKVLADILL
jgi:threonine-phosphate decarboxylase